MDTITLQADGYLNLDGKKVEASPLVHLGAMISVEKKATLRSYFYMLSKYPQLQELNSFFPTILDMYHQCDHHSCRNDQFDFLELTKTIEMVGFPGEPRLEFYQSFHGTRGEQTFEIRDYDLSTILDMDIRIGRLKHVIFGDRMDVFKFDTVFTLFEFIDGIAWELGFQWAPTECQLRS
ncbi:MAG: hypothetical protein HKM93_13845 [Desulfobacteraceae bacterium]|nr:hypothetical protein [Desulfobacteraceae bacterium]